MRERLAVDGGKPIRDTFLPYGRQWLGPEEERRVLEVLRSDWITTGPVTKEFEEKFAKFVGAKHAVACHTGTAALHLAVSAAGIGSKDEVVTTPFTFAATSNAVLYRGGTPVFADILPDTKNLDPEEARAAVTRKTRALIPVHFAGQPCDMDELGELAEKRDLVVIEDAAHAAGAEYRGRRIGSISDMTIFSFHPVKNMTTAEGGMVTTNSAELAERLRTFRAHGIVTNPEKRFGKEGSHFYSMEHLGHRFYMTELQAALGVCQLKKLPAFQERRRAIVAYYDRELADLEAVGLPVTRRYVKHAWHLYTIELGAGLDRDAVFTAMRAENIGVNVHYIPVHCHPYYRRTLKLRRGTYPVAEGVYGRILSLPLFPRMSDEDADDVVQGLRKVVDSLRRRRIPGAKAVRGRRR